MPFCNKLNDLAIEEIMEIYNFVVIIELNVARILEDVNMHTIFEALGDLVVPFSIDSTLQSNFLFLENA